MNLDTSISPKMGYVIFHPTPTASGLFDQLILRAESPSVSDQSQTEMCSSLDEIISECGTANWDEEGSKAVTDEAINKAKAFVKMLPTNIERPSIFARSNGSVSFQWSNGSKDGLLITFDASLEIHVVSITKFKKSSGPVVWNYGQIPSNIRSDLLRYTQLH